MTCDVSPVAMFFLKSLLRYTFLHHLLVLLHNHLLIDLIVVLHDHLLVNLLVELLALLYFHPASQGAQLS